VNSNWKEYTIQSLIDERQLYIGDGYRAKNDELSNTGIPFARAGNINNGFHFEDADYFPIQDLHKVGNKISKANDSVFTSKGTVGRFAFVRQETPQFVYSPQLCFWRGLNESYINSRFLYFWMHSWEFWEQIHGVKDQTDMAEYVSLSDQRNMKITLPPLPEQLAIAGVLSGLDDKIDLLHRQNKTLEGMAEALWRQVFVEEADPGWQKGKLGDLVELCYGKGLKEEKRIPGKYPVYGSNAVVGCHNDFLVEGPGIVIGRKGTLGVVNYVEENFFPIDTTFYIKSKTNAGKLFFEYFLLKEFAFEDMNSDSAVPGLNREIAESIELVIPMQKSIMDFNVFCEPLFTKKLKNDRQIRTLSRLRDTLLPKLMSGEVKVKL
jgi:type I restriction enzyme S subunit